MSDPCEIERKFLLDSLPELELGDSRQLRQGYICTGDTEVRLRSDGNVSTLTCKRGDGLVRLEREVTLTPEQFDALWPLTEGLRIRKTRHRIESDGSTVEIDVYEPPLEPLITAEVEFETEADSREFRAPSYFGEEVTRDPRYKNKNLARNGRPS